MLHCCGMPKPSNNPGAVHIYLHVDATASDGTVKELLNKLVLGQEKLMASLDETLAAVQAESTVDDSIIALLAGLKAQLDAVLAGGLTPEAQAKVDAIFAQATANSVKVSDAVTANTPAAP